MRTNSACLIFRTGHAVRKYFNNENFPIYVSCNKYCDLIGQEEVTICDIVTYTILIVFFIVRTISAEHENDHH